MFSMLSPPRVTNVQFGLNKLLSIRCARQLIVIRKLPWLGLKVEYLYQVDKGEDQNLTNEEDLV